MRPHTKFLVKLLKDVALHTCVEVGVFKGDNAYGLLASTNMRLLIGVDPYMRYPAFDDNLNNPRGVVARADLKQVRNEMLFRMEKFGSRFMLITDFSTNVASRYANSYFDFVFIDGNHAYPYVAEDIRAWLPKVRPGGILAGHDYVDKPKYGVIQACHEILPDHKSNKRAKVWWTIC